MELLELFTKAIAPQVLTRIFDNIPQYIILFGFIVIFIIKYLLKWNKARVEKIKAKELADEEKAKIKEERSQAIFKNTENLINKVDVIEKAQKETANEIKVLRKEVAEEIKVLRKETADEIKVLRAEYNTIDKKVAIIENKNETNFKQEGVVITMLNHIKNSIDNNKNKQ
jgi:hypothetical protein